MSDFDDTVMTLDDWLDEERRRLVQFEQYWRDRARLKENEKMFPMNMAAGEWDEQYRAYTEV